MKLWALARSRSWQVRPTVPDDELERWRLNVVFNHPGLWLAGLASASASSMSSSVLRTQFPNEFVDEFADGFSPINLPMNSLANLPVCSPRMDQRKSKFSFRNHGRWTKKGWGLDSVCLHNKHNSITAMNGGNLAVVVDYGDRRWNGGRWIGGSIASLAVRRNAVIWEFLQKQTFPAVRALAKGNRRD